MITRISVAGYRSLRDLRIDLAPLTVVTGPNGSGKSSLYRALRLLADVAQGRIVGALAGEGGLSSTLWAGPERFSAGMRAGTQAVEGTVRRGPVSLRLGVSGADLGYAIDLGLPAIRNSAFLRDPEIKAEALWTGPLLTPRALFAERRGPAVRLRDDRGAWREATEGLAPYDSMLTHAGDPRDGAELTRLRDRLRAWRFYDGFRTDRDAPARRPQVGTRTPALADDGADLAAAVQTIVETGDADGLRDTVADAFPSASLAVEAAEGLFTLTMRQHGLLRALGTAELSDGTLRFLLLAAALLPARPPPLIVLNEPEASLHPDLFGPLGRLIRRAATRTQVLVVSHSAVLAGLLDEAGAAPVALDKSLGETTAPGLDPPAWAWPHR